MKKRIYFNKCEDLRFISHLDLLRFFERVTLKADVSVKYSQGFHPRPKFSFGNPVSLGTEAFNEVMDMETEIDISNEEVFNKMNSVNVLGFKVLKVEDIIDKLSIVEKFKISIYNITGTKEQLDSLEILLSQEQIIDRKEKNGKIIERDLKEKISNYTRNSKENVTMNLINGSPNSYLDKVGIKLGDVTIKKMGYVVE
ncbi:MAG: TIGR03936 family radical SAM-associated protein [Fusobacteriaceae bacterium]